MKNKKLKLLLILSMCIVVFLYFVNKLLFIIALIGLIMGLLCYYEKKVVQKRAKSYLQYSTYINQEKRNYSGLVVGSTDAFYINYKKEDYLNYSEMCRSFYNDFMIIKNFFSAVKDEGTVIHMISLFDVKKFHKITPADKISINKLLLSDQCEMNKVEKALFYLTNIFSIRKVLKKSSSCSSEIINDVLSQCKMERDFCNERDKTYKVRIIQSGNSKKDVEYLKKMLDNEQIPNDVII